jgi:hypothetical protein
MSTADELLETLELVRTHYNRQLELAGVIVDRVERTVEHRESVIEMGGLDGETRTRTGDTTMLSRGPESL